MKEVITLNLDDWSGNIESFEIDRDTGDFKFRDYDFKLTKKEIAGEIHYSVTSPDWKDSVVDGFTIDGGVIMYDSCQGIDGITRSDKDPFKAAIKLLANII